MNRLLHIGAMGFLIGGAFWATSAQPALAHGPAMGRPNADHRMDHRDDRFRQNQTPFLGGNFGFGNGGNWGYGNCDDFCDDLYGFPGDWRRIPFFALHPPVYYSYPVARPYGYSPFAYPGAYLTPASEEGGSKEIINPFAPPTPTPAPKKAQPTASHTAAESASPDTVAADSPRDTVHVILNPYVGVSLADQGK